MKKIAKKFLLSSIVLVLFLFSMTVVSANTINKIDMDIYIDSNGNATVTEIWNTTLEQGTEGYKKYTNMRNASVSNFTVSDDTGRVYDTLSNWNPNASFNSKAYKNGIHTIPNGVELCWGISDYGNRTYTLKYDISGFVTQYKDTQGIYFDFLNLDQYIGRAKITIHSDIKFSLDNAKIWAFGYEGTDTFEDGSIILDSNGKLSSNQYMVGLVRFESDLFSTENKSNSTFDEIYDSAFEGVKEQTNEKNESEESIFSNFLTFLNNLPFLIIIIAIIVILRTWRKEILTFLIVLICSCMFGPIGFIITVAIIAMLRAKKKRKNSEGIDFGPNGKKLPSNSQINYWREIPCNADLERAYWLCSEYNIVSEETLNQGIIGAILLRWIKNGYVSVSKTKKGLFSFKDNNYAINLTKVAHTGSKIEDSLLRMMYEAAGSNMILEANEFSKWSKKNYTEIKYWISSIKRNAKQNLEQQGLIKSEVAETKKMFEDKKLAIVKKVTPDLREEAIKLKGLKKFLLDFSMMPEREHYEVHLWEEYLIFAQLLGIADKVGEQFSKLYPEFNKETPLNTDITTAAARNISEVCYEGMRAGIAIAAMNERLRRTTDTTRDYSGTTRDSGSGGSSYSSGGSSSGGSSGGGFR